MSLRENPIHEPGASNLRILLVDDHPEATVALQRLLAYRGYDVTVAGTGQEALDALARQPAFDILVTDLLLPDTDGLEVARHASALDPRPYILLVTGWSFEADLRDLDACGIDRLFSKPLDLTELFDTLDERFGHGSQSC